MYSQSDIKNYRYEYLNDHPNEDMTDEEAISALNDELSEKHTDADFAFIQIYLNVSKNKYPVHVLSHFLKDIQKNLGDEWMVKSYGEELFNAYKLWSSSQDYFSDHFQLLDYAL